MLKWAGPQARAKDQRRFIFLLIISLFCLKQAHKLVTLVQVRVGKANFASAMHHVISWVILTSSSISTLLLLSSLNGYCFRSFESRGLLALMKTFCRARHACLTPGPKGGLYIYLTTCNELRVLLRHIPLQGVHVDSAYRWHITMRRLYISNP